MIYTCPHSRPQTQYQYLIHGMIYSSGPRLLHQYSKRRNCKVNISCRDIDIVDGPISQPGEWLRKRPAHLQSTPRAVTRWTSRPGDWQRRRRAGIGAPPQSKPRAVTLWAAPPVQAALFWHLVRQSSSCTLWCVNLIDLSSLRVIAFSLPHTACFPSNG